MGFSSGSQVGFINICESGHGFVLKTGGTATSAERINVSGVGTVSLRKGNEEMVTAAPNGAVTLYFDGTQKLETTGTGIASPKLVSVQTLLHLLQSFLIMQEQYLVVQLKVILVFTTILIIHIFIEYQVAKVTSI